MKYLAKLTLSFITILFSLYAYAFDSGSTGADGAFNPTASTQLQLPPSGIFNFTEVNIPAGVNVRFIKNASNTPVRILISGDVTIDGVINLNGGDGGDFNDGSPGIGGPGGFDGGRGGLFGSTGFNAGGDGQGPGRGTGGANNTLGFARNAGAGSFGTRGQDGSIAGSQGLAGPTYGNNELLPLIGGSGGGGSSGQNIGSGGGGGGGAILIAASGTITVNGTISARGGDRGSESSSGRGGRGSGGGIRLVASTIQGEGNILADSANVGGNGRIRLEAENMLRTSNTTPAYSFGTPGLVLIANIPTIRFASVAGVAAPASPTGDRDVELPGITTNPVTVEIETTNIPLGTTIALTATPDRGTARNASSTPVSGSITFGTATASINLPNGNSVLSAQTTFTLTTSLGADFSKYAKGESVERVRVGINPEGLSETTFITISGKEFTYHSNAVAMQ